MEEVGDRWQWQAASVAAGGAPLVSEQDPEPGEVEFESMEAVRDAIKSFCWRNKSYLLFQAGD
jgi:hypothetical protein